MIGPFLPPGPVRFADGPRRRPWLGGAVSTVYSHSRLSCFEKCPKQFYYRYVERRPVETESIEAFVGKRVHEVLERLNHFVRDGRVPSLARVIDRFRREWESHFEPDRVRIVRRESGADDYRQLGERCLSHHYRRHYPFDAEETLGIEEHVAFALDDAGRYRIRGIIDRVARAADGAIEIHDYKTGRWVPSQQQLDEDRQLALYQLGVAERYGDGPVRLVWHYLARRQTRVSTRTPEQLEALRQGTIERIDEVEAERLFEPRPSNLCSWCEFNDICPAQMRSSDDEKSPTPVPRAQRAAGGRSPDPVASEPAGDEEQLPLL